MKGATGCERFSRKVRGRHGQKKGTSCTVPGISFKLLSRMPACEGRALACFTTSGLRLVNGYGYGS